MPPRLNRLLVALALSAGLALPACWSSGGCDGPTRCVGDELHECAGDLDSGRTELITDCSDNGRVCRQGNGTVACVFADQPCTADACAGSQIVQCTPLGLVGSTFDCARDEPGRGCYVDRTYGACGYPDVDCSASTDGSLCGGDGVSLYLGCSGNPHPQHRYDCRVPKGDVCKTTNGTALCAAP